MNAISFLNTRRVSVGTKEKVLQFIKYCCLFLFVYAGYAKIVDHKRFIQGLARVHIIHDYAMLISILVPFVEILIAFALIVPKTMKIGFISFIAITTCFTAYIISAMIWEPKLPCRCGGVIEKLTWTQHIWFNLAFIILAIVGVRLLNSIKK